MRAAPDQAELARSLDKIAYTLDKAYIDRLVEDYAVCRDSGGATYENNINIVQISRCVKNIDEKVIDCFKNVLALFSATANCNVALALRRTKLGTSLYFITRNSGEGYNAGVESKIQRDLLMSTLQGNFPGTKFGEVLQNGQEAVFGKDNHAVVSFSGVPSENSEDFVSQGIEKLLDGIVPKNDSENYTILIIAEPLSKSSAREIISGYEELASEYFVGNARA